MTGQLALPDTLWLRLSPALREAYERAAAHVRQPHAPNTQRAYESAWAAWATYCAGLGLPALPVDPRLLIGYLQNLSTESAPNTVRLQLAALAALDEGHAAAQGAPRKLRRHPIVSRWLKGWSRDHAAAPRRRAAALQPADLGRVLELAAEPGFNASRVAHAARFARDKSLITLGVAGALRISELVELELEHVRVQARPRGLVVFVKRAKNDQGGRGHTRVVLPQQKLCPIEAWEQWIRTRGDVAGALYCPIARNGLLELGAPLSQRQAMRMVTDRLRAAGVTRGSSHSMRATFGTLTKDWPLSKVMQHGNWRTARICLDYQRQGSLFDPEENPTSGLFDG